MARYFILMAFFFFGTLWSLTPRNSEIQPSLHTFQYVGTYTNSEYGSIAIENNDCGLDVKLLFCDEIGFLEHWSGDQFEILPTSSQKFTPFLCEFDISAAGKVTSLIIPELGVFEKVLTLPNKFGKIKLGDSRAY